jgi:hypothetical protein
VCADAAADAGACPAGSRVGSVSSLAGTGDAPVSLSGAVYLTGPYDGGFAGLAIVIPGKVGPVDLGTVIVRGSIALRADGGLDGAHDAPAAADRRRAGLDPAARAHVRPARLHPQRLQLRAAGGPRGARGRRRRHPAR